ncbi:uncharacterized protein EV422DRAFT_529655 [Fimicolochytrium jonesii]|uniref:uncharacterized protein n=1 Tax=Fimicolochytrium jonesii TaxID=1396493 RepID=UPI0022FF0946|nr:uncharacterized protein EV422DRAFT_529655 [Fimicolochytrium jonesii]KAI8820666.1 hypothetical protein EV422DRAFT_529655 [Fimicolochytrium jonesii]
MDPNAPLPPPQGPMGTASGLPPQPYLPPPQGQAGQAVPQNSAYPYADYRASYVDPRAHLPQRTASVSQHHQPGMYGPQAGAPRPMYAPQYYPAPASGGSPSLIPAGAPPAQRAYSVPHPYSQAPQQAPYYPGYNAPYGRVPYQHSPLHPRPYPVQARPPQGYPGGAAPPHPAGPASNRYSVMPPPHGQPIYPQQPDGDQIPQQQQQHDPNVQPPQPLQSQQQISSPSPLDGRSSPALQMQSPRPPAFAPNRYSMMPPSQQSVYPRQGAWMPEHGPPPYPMVKRDSVVSNASSNLSSRSQPVPPQTPQSASDYGSIPPAGTPASEVTQGELLHHTPSIRSDRSGRRQEHHEGTSYDENAAGPGQLRVMLQEELNKAIAEISRLSLLNDDLVAQKSQAESARRTSEAERDSAKSEVKQLTELLEIARAEAGDALGLRARVTELEGEVDRIKLEHGMALSVNEENKSALQTMENMRHRMADLEVQLSQAQMAAMQLKDRELSAGSEAQSRLAELEEQVNNLRRELAGSQTEAARLLKLKVCYSRPSLTDK